MSQPPILITVGATTLALDPDLYWADEFAWSPVEQAVEYSLTGALIVDHGLRLAGRPITLDAPDDNAAWMSRAVLTQLQTWEADPALASMTLDLRGTTFSVIFRRHDGAPVEARPVTFVADPLPGGFGDWYLTTLRFMVI